MKARKHPGTRISLLLTVTAPDRTYEVGRLLAGYGTGPPPDER